MRRFRDTDELPKDFDKEDIINESFIEYLMPLSLPKKDYDWLEEVDKQGFLSRWVFEIERGSLKGCLDEYSVYNYIDSFLRVGMVDVDKRLELVLDLVTNEVNMNKSLDFVEDMGDIYTEVVNRFTDDKDMYLIAVGVINRIINIDKNILMRLFKATRGGYLDEGELSILPSFNFELVKKDVFSEFKVRRCGGTLMGMLVKDREVIVGEVISDAFNYRFTEKILTNLSKVKEGGADEFSLSIEGRDLRTVLKVVEIEGDKIIRLKGSTTDVTELGNKGRDKGKEALYVDVVSGLASEYALNEYLEELVKSKEEAGVIFLDIDDFKLVNDQYGHGVGNDLLKEIGDRLKRCVRDRDVVARPHGDEFVILCRSVKGVEGLSMVAKRILSEVAGSDFEIGGNTISITVSVGVAVYPRDGRDAFAIVDSADQAMYAAKNKGKNRFMVFDESMRQLQNNKLKLQNELRKAIDRGEFRIVYQEMYDTIKGMIVGVEALVRWEHPEKGVLGPGDFIKEAEETGLIVDMGYSLIEESCRKLKELVDLGYDDLVLGVNISLLQFTQSNLVERIGEILEETGLESARVMVEVSEKTSMDDVEGTLKRFNELRDIGVNLSIDDFGTGYSSMLHLGEFPITNLKIDKKFIHNLDNESNLKLVNTVIKLADSLGFDVVAEGVETMDQYNKLLELGCVKFQGYLFGKPVGFDEIKEKIIRGDRDSNGENNG